ncbi:MAG: hypothetical protein ABR543_01585 [Gemmatimonadaceae bacterium]
MNTSGKLVLVLLLALSIPAATQSLVTREPSTAALTEIRGQGPKAAVACMGCVAGAGLVVAAGPAVIIAALWQPGGALAVAGCVAICAEALK